MRDIGDLLENNRRWSQRVTAEDPRFFSDLADQQKPDYLWIGCSDSRVAANTIVGLLPGEVVAHRNAANLLGHTDINCPSVVQSAVEVLQVRRIILCRHYGCAGGLAGLRPAPAGVTQ